MFTKRQKTSVSNEKEEEETNYNFLPDLPLEILAMIIKYLLAIDPYVLPNLYATSTDMKHMMESKVLHNMIEKEQLATRKWRTKLQFVIPEDTVSHPLYEADTFFNFLYGAEKTEKQNHYIHSSSAVIVDKLYLKGFFYLLRSLFLGFKTTLETPTSDFYPLSPLQRLGYVLRGGRSQHDPKVTDTSLELFSWFVGSNETKKSSLYEMKQLQLKAILKTFFGSASFHEGNGGLDLVRNAIVCSKISTQLTFAPGIDQTKLELFDLMKNRCFGCITNPWKKSMGSVCWETLKGIQRFSFPGYIRKLNSYGLFREKEKTTIEENQVALTFYCFCALIPLNIHQQEDTQRKKTHSQYTFSMLLVNRDNSSNPDFRQLITAFLHFESCALAKEGDITKYSTTFEIASTCCYSSFGLTPFRYTTDKQNTLFPTDAVVTKTKLYIQNNYRKKIANQFITSIFGEQIQ